MGCGQSGTNDDKTTVTKEPCAEPPKPKNGTEALKLLKDGNERFVSGKVVCPHRNKTTRDSLVGGQSPPVLVVCCSDSRVPPEILFDCGAGDLFIVRTAGHVLSDSTLASIEYGAEHLKCKLILVLGHQSCGAVNAAFDADDAAIENSSAQMVHLLQQIKPAVETVINGDEDRATKIKKATHCHVANTIKTIEEELGSILNHLKISTKGAYYNLTTGAVDFLDCGKIRDYV